MKVAILLLSLCFAIASAQQATGFLDSADFNSAAGWACIPSQPFRTLYVQIFVDGRFAGSAAATQRREAAVGQQCGGNSNKGFVFTFPGEFRQILSDGRSHTVRAIVQPFFPFFQRFELNNSPRTVFGGGNFPTPPPDNSALPRGFLDTASTSSVTGWACDPDAFNAALRIDLFIDGQFIASTTANQQREPAVGQQCGGNSFHGFTYNWDFNAQNILNDGNPHTVSAFANNFPFGNNFQLSGSPKTVIGNRVFPTFFPPPPGNQPRGFLDTAGTQSAAGWACDLDVPNQSLQVQIFANGQFLGTTIANQEREAAVGQQCGGNRFHGWRFNYPFFVSPGTQISAFAINAPTGGSVQLSNSPQSAS